MRNHRRTVLLALAALLTSACSSKPSNANNGSAGTAGFVSAGYGGGASGATGGSGGSAANGGSGGAFGSGTTGSSGVSGTATVDAGGGVAGHAAADGGGAGAAGSAAGSGGSGGSAGADADAGTLQPNSDPAYQNLAPTMGDPLDGKGTTLTPPAPTGWVWYPIAGAICRDGSPTGIFVHTGSAKKLLIFLEGGGACTNDHYCAFNPPNATSSLTGTGQTVIGSTFGVDTANRQQPGVYTDASHTAAGAGIFDFGNANNPVKDWNQVYVPYCTGDVHFGTHRDATVPNLAAKQQFVGYDNMKLFISRIVPTFKDKVDQVVLSGSSAGSFGAALNFSMVQDSFGAVRVDVIMDSGVPFTDKYMFTCMQKRWREVWGFSGSLPPDCTECQQADGGGLIGLADFVIKKHPNSHLAVISGAQDEVMRLFFSMGLKDCASYDTADPVAVVLGQLDPTVFYPAADYTAALNEMITRYVDTHRLATYLISGANPNYHEHLFRPELYQAEAGSKTEAAFVQGFLQGTVEQLK